MKYAYYPGCSAKNDTPELHSSMLFVARKLGLELVELKEAACCGSTQIKVRSRDLHLALNARTFAIAESQGLTDIITVCGTCQMYMATANTMLKENSEKLQEVNKILSRFGKTYTGGVNVRHLLWVLIKDVGLEVLKSKVVKPLTGLKIAPFYGCHILRPSKILGFDDPNNPSSLAKVIEAVGASSIDYVGKTKCCGFHILTENEKLLLRTVGARLKEAKEKGAECIVTPCPLCHLALDVYQRSAEKECKIKLGLPILHLAQLLGFAMGASQKDLMFSSHLVSPKNLLR